MTAITPDLWRAVWEQVVGGDDGAAGYYNFNHRAEVKGHEVIVRIPIPGCDEMDLRVWPEVPVMAAVRRAGVRAPAVLYSSVDPLFTIVEYIRGDRLDLVAPKGTHLPPHIVPEVVETITALHRVHRAELPSGPLGWPSDGDTSAFFRRLVDSTQSVYDRHQDHYGWLYRALGVPVEPLAAVLARADSLARRPFRALHCDLHRKNLIVRDEEMWVLDWELALWGDPVYEIAVHIHKMEYLPQERHIFFESVLRVLDPETLHDVDVDLHTFLVHEQCKSAIVDAVRYAKQAQDARTPPSLLAELCHKLAKKLSAAQFTWQTGDAPTADQVRGLLLAAREIPKDESPAACNQLSEAPTFGRERGLHG